MSILQTGELLAKQSFCFLWFVVCGHDIKRTFVGQSSLTLKSFLSEWSFTRKINVEVKIGVTVIEL